MTSGIPISDEVILEFMKLKARKINYVLYRLSDDLSGVVVDKSGSAATYDEFVKILPANEPRYAVYDYPYTHLDGRTTNKIILFSWLPESCPIKTKMVFTATKNTVRGALDSIATEIQATDYSDLDSSEVETRFR